ncbi:MAG: DUF445 family protein [Sulfurovaceae bacterium]|nr:DUF445 family protein [Sulfurovaceae bacterium]
MQISKSLITNIVAILFIAISFVMPPFLYKHTLNTGLYALSGALTNWLAIYMLFERVPLLYGSGVIEENFEAFKSSIHKMVMEQFFSQQNIQNFLMNEEMKIDLSPMIERADLSPAFEAVKATVMESKIGGMLSMFGGESLIDSYKESFNEKLKAALISLVKSQAFHENLQEHLQKSSLQDDLICSIDNIVSKRLDELTPQMIKELVKTLIDEHLGWLVVWGGVFGGLIGFIASWIV